MSSVNPSSRLPHEQIQYIEFLSLDLMRAKEFYTRSFNWKFTDYGEHYTAFTGDFTDGGFASGQPMMGSILVVLYSEDIEASKSKVVSARGIIVKDIFSFPGGRRFQFTDPDGYELAVWTDR